MLFIEIFQLLNKEGMIECYLLATLTELMDLSIDHDCLLIVQREKQQPNIFLLIGHNTIFEVILPKKFEPKYDHVSRYNSQFIENTEEHVKCHYMDVINTI